LKRIRYSAEQAPDDTSEEQPEFTVYSALVLEEQHLWLDLKMEMTRRVAMALYRAMLSEAPSSDAELCDALAEVCNMCQGAWKSVLEHANLVPITPGWPTARATSEFPQHLATPKQLGSSSFTLPGPIRVTFLEQVATVVDKPLNAITPGDVLADPINTEGQKLALLKRGTVLNTRYIARIRDLMDPMLEEDVKLHVIEPSPLALYMRRRWPRKAMDSSLTVIAKTDGKEKRFQGRVFDISQNGLGAIIFDILNPGQRVTLDFELCGDVTVRIDAIVRHRKGSRCGFEFQSIPPESLHKLEEVVRGLTA
jgi:hypothetical protein